MILGLIRCWFIELKHILSGIILCMRPANERRRYDVTSSFIGWAHSQNDPWLCKCMRKVRCDKGWFVELNTKGIVLVCSHTVKMTLKCRFLVRYIWETVFTKQEDELSDSNLKPCSFQTYEDLTIELYCYKKMNPPITRNHSVCAQPMRDVITV